MAYTNSIYDNCSYDQTLMESEGPGAYMLLTPSNVSEMCLADDPHIRAQSMGSKHIPGTSLIDVDSELMNITRPASQCPTEKYIPHQTGTGMCSAPRTHNMGASTDTIPQQTLNHEGFKSGIATSQHMNFSNCFKPTESTRLSNPPCTLRGTGWNRWEWLCKNPQDRIEVPFDHMIDSVLMAKDNHRPLLPKPMSQTAALPIANNQPICETLAAVPEVPTGPPSINWRRAADYGY